MWCVVCGRTSQEIQIVKLPSAMSPDLGVCVNHAQRYAHQAAGEADRQLAEAPYTWVPREQPYCHHCNAPVLWVGRRAAPLWCQACERERRRIAEGGRP